MTNIDPTQAVMNPRVWNKLSPAAQQKLVNQMQKEEVHQPDSPIGILRVTRPYLLDIINYSTASKNGDKDASELLKMTQAEFSTRLTELGVPKDVRADLERVTTYKDLKALKAQYTMVDKLA